MALDLILAKPEIAHPVKKQGKGGDVGIPLSLLYLGAYARQQTDAGVEIRDYRLDRALGKERNLERDFRNSDIIGTGACTAESPDATNILRQAKEMGKTTIMGGLYATFNSEKVLSEGSTDFVVRGEGEKPLADLLNALDKKGSIEDVKGISYRKGDQIIHNPNANLIEDLDSLPLPAYDLIDIELYSPFGSAPIYSARGCSMTCDFCTLNEMWGFRHRARSTENIIKELEMLKGFGFDRVHFKDETVTLNKRNAMNLFGEIEKAGLGLSYKAKSRINQIDPELLEQMMSAGLDTIHTGVESIVQNTLDRMKKGISEQSIRRTFDMMQSYNCNINPVYLIGSSGETEKELQANAEFAREMGQRSNVITYLSFMTPHPGTKLADDPEMEILSTDYSRYTHKQPVAVPISLGKNGLIKMVNTYHSVVQDIGMEHVNPIIDKKYFNKISEKSRREVLVV